jgi:hypothetical protein
VLIHAVPYAASNRQLPVPADAYSPSPMGSPGRGSRWRRMRSSPRHALVTIDWGARRNVSVVFFAVRLKRGGPWDWSRDLREQDGWDEHARFMDSSASRPRASGRWCSTTTRPGRCCKPTRSMLQTDDPYPSIGSQKAGVQVNTDTSVDLTSARRPPPGQESNRVQTWPGQGLERDPAPPRAATAVVRQDLAPQRNRTIHPERVALQRPHDGEEATLSTHNSCPYSVRRPDDSTARADLELTSALPRARPAWSQRARTVHRRSPRTS